MKRIRVEARFPTAATTRVNDVVAWDVISTHADTYRGMKNAVKSAIGAMAEYRRHYGNAAAYQIRIVFPDGDIWEEETIIFKNGSFNV